MAAGTAQTPLVSPDIRTLSPTNDSCKPSVPIYYLAHHYYLYHAQTIAHLRSTYSVPGTLIGTLPQSAQQNVFLGLPLLLMPEEVTYLCDLGVAYIVDDAVAHRKGIRYLERRGGQERGDWMRTLVEAGAGVARGLERQKGIEREKALNSLGDREIGKRAKRRAAEEQKGKTNTPAEGASQAEETKEPANLPSQPSSKPDGEASLFDEDVTHDRQTSRTPSASSAPNESKRSSIAALPKVPAYTVTPTTSHPPLPLPLPSDTPATFGYAQYQKATTPSSPLHAHLTRLAYVLTPGLRFGCQYLAYPGDPLRFHSHFLVVGRGWKEEVELATLVGLGRLGTGVKKGVCFGGVEDGAQKQVRRRDDGESPGPGESEDEPERVRCFTIEWGGM